MSGLIAFLNSSESPNAGAYQPGAQATDEASKETTGAFAALLDRSRQNAEEAQASEADAQSVERADDVAPEQPGDVNVKIRFVEMDVRVPAQQAANASLQPAEDAEPARAPTASLGRWSNVAVVCAAAAYGTTADAKPTQPAPTAQGSLQGEFVRPRVWQQEGDQQQAELGQAQQELNPEISAMQDEQADAATDSERSSAWADSAVNFAMATAWAQTTQQATAFEAAHAREANDAAAGEQAPPQSPKDSQDFGAPMSAQVRTAQGFWRDAAPSAQRADADAAFDAQAELQTNAEKTSAHADAVQAKSERQADAAATQVQQTAATQASQLEHAAQHARQMLEQLSRADAGQKSKAELKAAVADTAAAEAAKQGGHVAPDRAELEYMGDEDDEVASASAEAPLNMAAAAFALGSAQAWLEMPVARTGAAIGSAAPVEAAGSGRDAASMGADGLVWFADMAMPQEANPIGALTPLPPMELPAPDANGSDESVPAVDAFAAAAAPRAMSSANAKSSGAAHDDDDGADDGPNDGLAGESAAAALLAARPASIAAPAPVAEPVAPMAPPISAAQVSEELAQAIGFGGRSIRLKVAPPGMGELAVDVRVVGNRVQMAVTGDAQHLASALRAQAEQLQESLKSQGLQLDSLDFRGAAPDDRASASQQERRSDQEAARESREFERLFGAPAPRPRADAPGEAPQRRRGMEQVIYVTA